MRIMIVLSIVRSNPDIMVEKPFLPYIIYISGSDSLKQYIRKIALFVILFVLTETVLTMFLEPYTMQMQVERQISYKIKQGITPDTIILGDSTVGSGIDPAVLQVNVDTVKCAVNAASGNQPLQGSYYYLRYLKMKYPSVQRVILGLAYDQLIDSQTNMKKKLIVLDRIKDPFLWFSYARTFIGIEDLPFLLKSYRYRDENVIQNIKEKWNGFIHFEPTDSIGYSPYTSRLDPQKGEVGMGALDWDEALVDAESQKALENIVFFCDKNDIQLYIVTMPVGDALFWTNEGCEGAHDYISEIAEGYNVLYLDMNLWRKREKANSDERMADNVHVMANLASELTESLARIIRDESSTEELFESVSEAREQIHGILWLTFATTPNEDGSRIVKADSICTDGMKPRYQFCIYDSNGNILLESLQTESGEFVLPSEYVGQKLELSLVAYASIGSRDYSRTYSITVDQNTWN